LMNKNSFKRVAILLLNFCSIAWRNLGAYNQRR
jgi:hypothetical protein